ncbi:MAG: PPOX class F420-dependent oxidoreductase [Gaiellaceae bacterium]
MNDDLRALLEETRYAILATNGPDGTIHLTPVWFLFDDGRFYFESFSGSRKVKNILENPSASVVVDGRQPGRESWVSAAGTADVLTGDESRTINADVRRRYMTQAARDDPRIEPVFAAADDVTIRLTPTRWRSWAAKDLDAQFFGGILGGTPEQWFLPVEV